MPGPSVTDWISAVATVFLGILGAGVTLWVAYQGRFRPHATAMLEADRKALAVRITNRGGTAGVVDRIDAVPSGLCNSERFTPIPTMIGGLQQGQDILPFILPEGGLASLILLPSDAGNFPSDIAVRVQFGDGYVCVSPDSLSDGIRLVQKTLIPGDSP
jgi:hypothetical protein